MKTNGQYVSQYTHRVNLVAEVVKGHTQLDDKTATELAVHILRALDHIPEKIR